LEFIPSKVKSGKIPLDSIAHFGYLDPTPAPSASCKKGRDGKGNLTRGGPMSSAKTKKYESGTEIEIRDSHFHKVAEARLDSKRRLVLGRTETRFDRYVVFENEAGQIVLDPVISIPAREAWLYKSPEAMEALLRGFADAKAGRIRKVEESEL
jgi:hypothetical protein